MIKSGFVTAFNTELLSETELYAIIYPEFGYFYSTSLKVILKISKVSGKHNIGVWNGNEWSVKIVKAI